MKNADNSGGFRPSDKGKRGGGGGGGNPDPEIRGARSPKNFFRDFGPHFGRKLREGRPPPRAPPLDPPLDNIAFASV